LAENNTKREVAHALKESLNPAVHGAINFHEIISWKLFLGNMISIEKLSSVRTRLLQETESSLFLNQNGEFQLNWDRSFANLQKVLKKTFLFLKVSFRERFHDRVHTETRKQRNKFRLSRNKLLRVRLALINFGNEENSIPFRA